MARPVSTRAAPAQGYLNITVTEPVTHSDTIGSFVSYKVNTVTDRSDFPYGQFTVVRRYSDFCWLHDQLVYAFPGAIIPPLPEKNVVRRFSQEFIEVRRRALERFLNRVAAHTELVACPHFHTFLQADDAGLAKAKEDTKQEKQKKGLVQWFDNTMTSLSSSAMNRDDIRTPADSQVEEEAQYISQLETQLQNVVKHTTILIKRNREIANALFEFGLAFTLLGQTEGESLGAALQQVGNNADQMSVATAEQAENEAMQFEEPLQEYIRIVGAVKVALQKRHEKKLMYVSAVLELESKQAAYQKALNTPGKEEKAQQLQASVDKAQQAADAAREEHEKVTARLLEELQRFKEEKAVDMRKILVDYVQLQIDHNKALERSWQDLVPKLQAITFEGGSGIVGSSLGTAQDPSLVDSTRPVSTYSSAPYGYNSHSHSAFRETDDPGDEGDLVGV